MTSLYARCQFLLFLGRVDMVSRELWEQCLALGPALEPFYTNTLQKIPVALDHGMFAEFRKVTEEEFLLFWCSPLFLWHLSQH